MGMQELQAELAGLQASNAELQSRAQREQQEGGREREAAAAARIPELQRRIEALTQAQGEAASAARCVGRRHRRPTWRALVCCITSVCKSSLHESGC